MKQQYLSVVETLIVLHNKLVDLREVEEQNAEVKNNCDYARSQMKRTLAFYKSSKNIEELYPLAY